MKIRLLIALLVCGSLVWAQAETQAPSAPVQGGPSENVTKVIHVHGNAEALANMSRTGMTVVKGNSQLRAVVVSGKPADVADVVRTINDLDTAGTALLGEKNIELVVYVVNGSIEPIPGLPESADLLAPVYKQLRAIFPYKSYQLLDTMLMRSGQNSAASTSGIMRTFQNNVELNQPTNYSIRYDAATISGEATPSIRLAKFSFEAHLPFTTDTLPSGPSITIPYAAKNYGEDRIGIETNVDLREGQKVVVGTANPSMFLVLSARVVQ